MAPASFHLIPESRIAIVTSGRPVVVRKAVWTAPSASTTWAPRTPPSSTGLALLCRVRRVRRRRELEGVAAEVGGHLAGVQVEVVIAGRRGVAAVGELSRRARGGEQRRRAPASSASAPPPAEAMRAAAPVAGSILPLPRRAAAYPSRAGDAPFPVLLDLLAVVEAGRRLRIAAADPDGSYRAGASSAPACGAARRSRSRPASAAGRRAERGRRRCRTSPPRPGTQPVVPDLRVGDVELPIPANAAVVAARPLERDAPGLRATRRCPRSPAAASDRRGPAVAGGDAGLGPGELEQGRRQVDVGDRRAGGR